MAETILIDTDVLINVIRGTINSAKYLDEIRKSHRLAISAVTQMEMIVGCHDKSELREVIRFFGHYQILQVSKSISETAVNLLAKYRLSHGLLLADALIAATALSVQAPLFTHNQRHFRFIENLALFA